MTILVTGGAGRLARALKRADGARVQTMNRVELDVTQEAVIQKVVARLAPTAVINTAATSSVDAAEADPTAAFPVNAAAPGFLARVCAQAGMPFIHISTDYVFGRETDRPRSETDAVSPINAYGRMKAEGESRVLSAVGSTCVVRVAWLFGDGEDFIAGLLRCGLDQPVKVAEDQTGSPTPIDQLAERLVLLADRMSSHDPRIPQILHLAGTPPVTRADWVSVAFEALRRQGRATPTMERVPMSTFPSLAARPRFSALDGSLSAELFGDALQWKPLTSDANTFTGQGLTCP